MGLRDRARESMAEAREQAAAQQAAAAHLAESRPHSGIEYRVENVREKLVGDHIDSDTLQGLLNRLASEGWTLKQIISANVKGRVGPGGSDGLIAIFERPTAP